MFLHIIFDKLGMKKNKYVLAAVYSLIYFILVYLIFFAAAIYLGRNTYVRDIFISLGIAIVMYIVYLIKWEIFLPSLKK